VALCAAGLDANLIASDSKPSDLAAVDSSQQETAPVVGHDPEMPPERVAEPVLDSANGNRNGGKCCVAI
jgi:hypothetical protein